MVCLLCGNNRRESSQRKMDTGEASSRLHSASKMRKIRNSLRDQIRLELVQVDIEGTIEAKRCRDRRYDLGDKAVEVRERGLGNVQAVLADVVDSLVVDLGPGCQ